MRFLQAVGRHPLEGGRTYPRRPRVVGDARAGNPVQARSESVWSGSTMSRPMSRTATSASSTSTASAVGEAHRLGDYIVPWSMKWARRRAGSSSPTSSRARPRTPTSTPARRPTARPHLRAARSRIRQGSSRQVDALICTERNRKNFAALSARMSGGRVGARDRASRELRAALRRRARADGHRPALILLDPIG